MTYQVRLRRAAESDIARAQGWYEAQRPGLGAEFQAEVGTVLGRLSETPLIYAKQYGDVRRAVLQKFPYLLWFRIIGKRVQVLAVTDARQNPAKTEARFQ